MVGPLTRFNPRIFDPGYNGCSREFCLKRSWRSYEVKKTNHINGTLIF